MITTGEAGRLIGRATRTIERMFNAGEIAGGRPSNPVTMEPLPRSHRWIDLRHAVLYAIGNNRAHLIPPQWRYLIPRPAAPQPVAPGTTDDHDQVA